jgi:hypothetical protein
LLWICWLRNQRSNQYDQCKSTRHWSCRDVSYYSAHIVNAQITKSYVLTSSQAF